MAEQYVIIVAGGKGTRMKSELPKQFIALNGEALILKTIRCFLNYDSKIHIIICVHKDYETYLEDLLAKSDLKNTEIKIVLGGDTRFNSVKNGLQHIEDDASVVGIHDAARPFVSIETIRNCYSMAAQKGNAIPCVPIKESMRRSTAEKNEAVNRSEYKLIQTPQCFLVAKIKNAFEREFNPAFTDDATVLESIGEKIFLVEGNEENIKITSPHDLIIAQALLQNE